MRFPLISKIFFFLACGLFVISFALRILFTVWDFTSLFYLFSFFACFFLSIVLDVRGYYELLTLKSTKRGLSYVGGVLLVFAAIVGLNYAMTYVPIKADVSEGSYYTLSPLSKSVAKSFTEPVEFLYVQVPTTESKDMDERIRTAIRIYQDENPRFSFRKVNLLMEPQIVKEYNLNEQESALFVTTKDRKERFYTSDENGITQALLRLLKGRKTIYFVIGDGEATVTNDKSRGLKNLRREVERLFYDVQEINLSSEVLPKDAAGVVLIGPEMDLPERVQDKLFEFFEGGGRLFVAFDPINEMKPNPFLAKFGLAMEDGIVHQEQSVMANMGSHVITGLISDQKHPVMKEMEDTSPVLFYVTGSLKTLDPNVQAKVLVQSPKTSVLRSGFTKQDKFIKDGPFNLVMQVTGKNGGEIFFAADSDVFGNQFLYQHANPQFMFNLFSYLSKDEDIVGKSPQSDKPQFFVTDIQLKIFIGLFIIPLPILLFSAGTFLWFRRRWL